jgi:hypothetical protein
MNKTGLKEFLDKKVDEYNQPFLFRMTLSVSHIGLQKAGH